VSVYRPVEDEFEAFVRHRSAALLRAAYLLTGDRFLAEDLVQAALARTHLHWDKLREARNAEAYTRRTMYHLQVSWWRRRRVAENVVPEPPERPAGGDEYLTATDRIALRRALLQLPVKQRAVLVLRYFEDRTEPETARILDISVGTVKSHASRGLARLRQLAPELAGLDTDLDTGLDREVTS
jgi:RNA polymerase sigma-70 factor (sigma-E family)